MAPDSWYLALSAVLFAIGVVGAFSLGGFDQAWFKFHELMFSNSFWQLNPRTDHLIQMFPPAFWEFIVSTIGLLTAAEAGLTRSGGSWRPGSRSAGKRTREASARRLPVDGGGPCR